jgi:hypothetical protein
VSVISSEVAPFALRQQPFACATHSPQPNLRSARMCSRNDDSSGDTWQAGSYAQIFVLVGSLRLQVQKRSKRREADSTMETAPNARVVSSWARLALLNFPDPGVARSWFCPEASERRSSDSPSPRRRSAHAPRDSSPGAFAPPVISTGHAPNKPIALNELPEPDITPQHLPG